MAYKNEFVVNDIVVLRGQNYPTIIGKIVQISDAYITLEKPRCVLASNAGDRLGMGQFQTVGFALTPVEPLFYKIKSESDHINIVWGSVVSIVELDSFQDDFKAMYLKDAYGI